MNNKFMKIHLTSLKKHINRKNLLKNALYFDFYLIKAILKKDKDVNKIK